MGEGGRGPSFVVRIPTTAARRAGAGRGRPTPGVRSTRQGRSGLVAQRPPAARVFLRAADAGEAGRADRAPCSPGDRLHFRVRHVPDGLHWAFSGQAAGGLWARRRSSPDPPGAPAMACASRGCRRDRSVERGLHPVAAAHNGAHRARQHRRAFGVVAGLGRPPSGAGLRRSRPAPGVLNIVTTRREAAAAGEPSSTRRCAAGTSPAPPPRAGSWRAAGRHLKRVVLSWALPTHSSCWPTRTWTTRSTPPPLALSSTRDRSACRRIIVERPIANASWAGW